MMTRNESLSNRRIWWCLAMIGLGFLLPWDAIITAVDYLQDLFPNEHVEFKVAASYMICNFTTMALTVYFDINKYANVYIRMFSGFVLLLVLMLIIGFITNLSLFIFCVCLAGVGDGFTQISVYGYTAVFETNDYSGAVMSGNGLAGLAAVTLRIITKISFPSDRNGLKNGARVHFFVTGAVLIMCLCCVFYLSRNNKRQSPPSQHQQSRSNSISEEVELVDHGQISSDTIVVSPAAAAPPPPVVVKRGLYDLMWSIRHYGLCVFINFVITLALFPGLTSEFKSEMFALGDWFPVLVMAAFMIFDYVGRTRPTFNHCGLRIVPFIEGEKLLKLSLLRIIFIPLLFVCYFSQKDGGIGGGKILSSDLTVLFIVCIFALSNGYVSTVCMMYGPTMINDRVNREIGGNLMAFCLVSGLTIGATIGILISLAL